MSLAETLGDLASQVRALEAEVASLRRENKRLRHSQSRPPASPLNPWAVLGVPKGADVATINAAFRRLSKQHHPDSPRGDRAAFEALVEAKAQLLEQAAS